MSLNYLEISTPRPFTATPATFSFMSLHYLTLILLHVFTLPGSLHRHPRHVSPPPSLILPSAPHQETFTLQQKRRNGSGLDRTNCGPGICGVCGGGSDIYEWLQFDLGLGLFRPRMGRPFLLSFNEVFSRRKHSGAFALKETRPTEGLGKQDRMWTG